MIDTISLKTSLIDLAVSGRLSTEFQAEDSVSEIIEKLPAPSSKRKKLLGQAFEYGKQPDIPDNWRWMPLGDISSYGDTPVKANTSNVTDNTWILDLEDIKAGGELLTKTRANEKQFAGEKTIFHSGQVLYSKLRPYLKKVLVADEDGISTPELISFDVFGGILPQYMVFWLLGSFTNRAIDKRSYGIKMPRIDAGFMVNLPVPVPPVSEQQYIIERLESAFALIDTIDNLQSEYASNQEALKSKLIDTAIQGKLTEQFPGDGTAEDLYQIVQEKKDTLIKSKRIKKDKSELIVAEENIPFDIPNNWKWVCWGEIVNIVSARRVHQSDWRKEGIPFYRAREIAKLADNGFVDNDLYISEELYDEFSKSGVPSDGDLMVSAVGTLGKTYVVKESDHFYYKDASVLCFENYADVDPYYLRYVMNSDMMKKQIESNSGGTTVDTLTMVRMIKYLLPLPPLAEQHRIVEKLDAMLSLIA